jgi:hypothetical protein
LIKGKARFVTSGTDFYFMKEKAQVPTEWVNVNCF